MKTLSTARCHLVWMGLSLWGLISIGSPTPIGYYNKGKLKNALSFYDVFKKQTHILSVSPKKFQYGTFELQRAIEQIADWTKQLQRHPLKVGDISKKRGGKLARHVTHQMGLDADIGYLVFAPRKTGHRWKHYHNRFSEQLESRQKITKNFDTESNYKLLDKISKNLRVNKIFVGCGIYKALDKWEKKHSGTALKKVFAWKGHEDHFHVRLNCPDGSKDCSHKWWHDPNKKKRKKGKKKPLEFDWNGKRSKCGW